VPGLAQKQLIATPAHLKQIFRVALVRELHVGQRAEAAQRGNCCTEGRTI